jgi:hypothetical protein
MSSPSDVDVMRRSLSVPEAFGLIYDRHAPTLLRFLGRRAAANLISTRSGPAAGRPA